MDILLLKELIGEFLGIFLLILLGNGVCSSLNYKKMYAKENGGNWTIASIGWGLSVLIALTVSNAVGGLAHINPAYTIFAGITNIDGNFPFWKVFLFIPIQLIGAYAGQMLLYLLNWNHIKDNELSATLSSSCCSPNYTYREKGNLQNFLYEFVATTLLIGLVFSLSAKANADTQTLSFPFGTAFIVTSIGMALGSVTGCALNPARDLAPRFAFTITTRIFLRVKANANWSYGWIPAIAPMLAGTIFGLIILHLT